MRRGGSKNARFLSRLHMSIKILIDMNLSPDWVPLLHEAGWSATHWCTVGDPKATDRTIMDWAGANG